MEGVRSEEDWIVKDVLVKHFVNRAQIEITSSLKIKLWIEYRILS